MERLEDVLRSKLILGRIHSIDETKGMVEVSYITETGFQKFNIPSVFGGNDSWIRAYPQVGSYVLISETTEKQFPEIVKVFDPSEKTRYLLSQGVNINSDLLDESSTAPTDRVAIASTIAADDIGKIGQPYRQLRAGEIEASSNGKASFWLGRNGELVVKGGLSKLEMDPFKNTIETFSAGHLKLGLDSSLDSFADQEYFGVVRRPAQRKGITGTVNALKNRISKISNVELSYERLQTTIDFYSSNIFQAKNEAVVAYLSAYDAARGLKRSQFLDTIKENLIVLKNSLTLYIETTIPLINFVNTYLPSISTDNETSPTPTVSFETLKNLPDTVKSFSEKVQNFINKCERPQDNEIGSLLAEIRDGGSNFLQSKEFPVEIDINIGEFNSVISLEIKKIPPGLEILKERRENLDKQRSEEEEKLQESAEKIDRKYLNPELKLNPEANSDQLFAKEYRVNVSWKKTNEDQASTIYEKVAGHVYDKDGLPASHGSMKRLRSKETFVTESNEETNIYVDTDGNIATELSLDADQGYSLVVPKGNINMTAGKELKVQAGSNNSIHTVNLNGGLQIQVKGNNITITCPNGEIALRASKITLDAPQIIEQGEVKKENYAVKVSKGQNYGNPPVPGIDPSVDNKSKDAS